MTESNTQAQQELQYRYLGDIQGNVLDGYDNRTYNARLFVTPKSPNWDSPGKTPEGSYILAQTGVTAGTIIDNIEIVNVPGQKNIISTINFTIRQPNAVDFIDQILKVQQKLGYGVIATEMPMFLEMNFQGYIESDESFDRDSSVAGRIADIAGPYVYSLILSQISMQITPSGSVYEVKTVFKDDFGFSNTFYNVPLTMTTNGTTITEHVRDLEEKINMYWDAIKTGATAGVTVKFDLTTLLKPKPAEPDNTGEQPEDTTGQSDSDPQREGQGDTPPADGSETADSSDTNIFKKIGKTVGQWLGIIDDEELKPENDANKITAQEQTATDTTEELVQVTEGTVLGQGVSEEGKPDETISINVPEDTSIYTYFGQLLVTVPQFTNNIVRGNYAQLISTDDADPSKTDVLWYGVKTTLKYLEWDDETKRFKKQITFIPYIYNTQKTAQMVKEAEAQVAEQDQLSRVQQMRLRKAYHYWYSGLNDQILNLDIRYDPAHTLLLPPKDGAVGDMRQNVTVFRQTNPLDPDTITGSLGSVLSELQSLFQGVKDLLGAIGKLSDTAKTALATVAGLSSLDAKDLLKNAAGAVATGLANALKDELIGKVLQAKTQELANATMGSNNPTNQYGTITESDRQKDIDNSVFYTDNYTATPDYYKYAEDEMYEVVVKTIDDYINEQKNNVAQNVENDDTAANLSTCTMESYMSGPGDLAPQATGAGSTIFNYVYNQNEAEDALMRIELTVRGDPYFLGPNFIELADAGDAPINPSENPNHINVDKDNFFLLTVNFPRRFDLADNDDDNSGLWYPNQKSYFISGIYRIRKVVNNFSNGIYTVDIVAVKETGIMLDKLEETMVSSSFTLNQGTDFIRKAGNLFSGATGNDAFNGGTEFSSLIDADPVAFINGYKASSGQTELQMLENGVITSAQYQAYINQEGG